MAAVSSAKSAAQEASSRAGSNGHGDKAPVPEFNKEQELAAYRDMLADPPLRGKGRPDVRHGPDRRLLPPLYRPGSRRRRHADGAEAGRPGHHRLPRPRPHAGLRHGPERRDGRADRPPQRLFPGQGRLDAHVLRREGLLRRPRHRRRPGAARHRARLRQPLSRQRQCLPDLFRRRRRQSGPGLRELQHGGAVEAAGRLRDREQPLCHGHLDQPLIGARSICRSAASPSTSRASRSTAWMCAR